MTPLLLTLFVTAPAPKVPQELYSYLRKPDSTYSYKVLEKDDRGYTVQMTSQTWQSGPWQHQILIRYPTRTVTKGTGVLYITGDGPRDGDIRQLNFVTDLVGLPVAMLFNIPNQPTWGMKEDDLIAHTFEKYLETGDATWPLLFPMCKSALRAMDAVQAVTKTTDNPLNKFVVTGASKRGWTTWFVGAAHDKRVVGIAPMVFDNLNVVKQMPHQLESWGKYSEQIEEYTRRGLQAKLVTPKGQKLAQIIDPYSYRSQIKVPTLIVIGANDPYWTIDSMRFYWNDLKQPHWAQVIPNAGHDLGGGLDAANSIGAFARMLATKRSLPKFEAEIAPGKVTYTGKNLPEKEMAVWFATSETTDFRLSKWQKVALTAEGDSGTASFAMPDAPHVAAYVETRFKVDGRRFGLSCPPKVLR